MQAPFFERHRKYAIQTRFQQLHIYYKFLEEHFFPQNHLQP